MEDLTEQFQAAAVDLLQQDAILERAAPTYAQIERPRLAAQLLLVVAVRDLTDQVGELANQLEELLERTRPKKQRVSENVEIEEDEEVELDLGPPVIGGNSPISLLQEICAKRGIDPPRYEIWRMKGSADHMPKFNGDVMADGRQVGLQAPESSKQKAKEALALLALKEVFGAID